MWRKRPTRGWGGEFEPEAVKPTPSFLSGGIHKVPDSRRKCPFYKQLAHQKGSPKTFQCF